MSYLDKNLLPGEKVLFRTKKHLIIFAYPVFWSLFCMVVSYYVYSDPLVNKLLWAFWLVALILWLYIWLEYTTSEFVVTDKRVMMKEGFFNRHTNEMRISTISQVNVDQTILGQILNYGMVSINAFGAFDSFTVISRPFLFQKVINEQVDKITTA